MRLLDLAPSEFFLLGLNAEGPHLAARTNDVFKPKHGAGPFLLLPKLRSEGSLRGPVDDQSDSEVGV